MFAPDGYVAIARLRGDFEREHLKWCCARSCEFYKSNAFDQKDIFGSPRDLCEDLFLASLADYDVTICAPDGKTLTLPTDLAGTNAKLFQKANVMESSAISTFPDEAGEDRFWLSRIGSPQFKPTPHLESCVAGWVREYSKLAEPDEEIQAVNIPFHTLPYLYERQSLTIAQTFPPWSQDMIDDSFRNNLPDLCRGWAICLSVSAVNKWRKSRVGASLSADLRRIVPSFSSFSIDLNRSFVGRPRKIDELKRFYLKFESELEPLSWKERLRFLELSAGLRVSLTTLRNAVRDLKAKK